MIAKTRGIFGGIPWKKGVAAAFWLAVWECAAWIIDRPILLVGPSVVLRTLLRLAVGAEFWKSVFGSLVRIGLGFTLALLSGLLLGVLAHCQAWLRELLSPVISVMKAVPVASFVILVLIWAGANSLAVVVSFFVVFPMIYVNTLAGLRAADRQLLEMARVFGMGLPGRGWYLYRPALMPYLISACRTALGMSWKSGVAAEVIGTPARSIGGNLYMAKVFFSTDELLAWTMVVIVLSVLFEKCVLLLLRQAGR